MSISIGKYISQKLKDKGISHNDAAVHIGLSKSAFEKILTQNDIYTSRLLKLSQLLEENLLKYYNDYEPLKTFIAADKQKIKSAIEGLEEKIADQTLIISYQVELIRLLKDKQ